MDSRLPLLLLQLQLLIISATPLPSPYLSPSFFPNYQKMLKTFKIFIYNNTPPPPHSFTTTAESLFHASLLDSSFVTTNPDEAHLFYLHFPPTSSPRSISRHIRDLQVQFPFWNRTLGADHFFLSCNGVRRESDRNLVELKKNSIQISCFGESAKPHFIPHKDIVLPPLLRKHDMKHIKIIRHHNQEIASYSSNLTVHFDSSNSDSVVEPNEISDIKNIRHHESHFDSSNSDSVVEPKEISDIKNHNQNQESHFDSSNSDSDIRHHNQESHFDSSNSVSFVELKEISDIKNQESHFDSSNSDSEPKEISDIKFCLFSYGDDSVKRIGEALRQGCVPVVVVERPMGDLVFADVLRWAEVAVFVEGVEAAKRVVGGRCGGRYEDMREMGMVVGKHFEWSLEGPPQPYDGFHMVLYQLWMRRHTIRYTRREVV